MPRREPPIERVDHRVGIGDVVEAAAGALLQRRNLCRGLHAGEQVERENAEKHERRRVTGRVCHGVIRV
jgi:hypothetical protein